MMAASWFQGRASGEGRMKRIVIFTVLFPPLALLVFLSHEAITRGTLPPWLLDAVEFAYVVAIIPAWLSAGADWAQSNNSIYLRMTGTMAVGAASVFAELAAVRFESVFSNCEGAIMTALVGAIPAAICSLLCAWSWGRQAQGNEVQGM
jgi:hypothetical protein